jgi:hypothetical protein
MYKPLSILTRWYIPVPQNQTVKTVVAALATRILFLSLSKVTICRMSGVFRRWTIRRNRSPASENNDWRQTRKKRSIKLHLRVLTLELVHAWALFWRLVVVNASIEQNILLLWHFSKTCTVSANLLETYFQHATVRNFWFPRLWPFDDYQQ